jgi:anti-anti-sigma regulatory factor
MDKGVIMASKAKIINLPIEGELTIFRTQALRETIMANIVANDEVEIDLSGITEVDAAGMQLMVASKLEAILRGKTLRYAGHSKTVLEMIDLCDLGSFFGDQIVTGLKTSTD